MAQKNIVSRAVIKKVETDIKKCVHSKLLDTLYTCHLSVQQAESAIYSTHKHVHSDVHLGAAASCISSLQTCTVDAMIPDLKV